MRRMLISLFFLLFAFDVLARLPTQPAKFDASSPLIAWTFSQLACRNRQGFPDDVRDSLSFFPNPESGCPTRVQNGLTIANAVRGATITSALKRTAAIETPPIGDSLSELVQPSKEWSFAVILTPTKRQSCDGRICYLIELGPPIGDANTEKAPSSLRNYFEIILDARNPTNYFVNSSFETEDLSLKYSCPIECDSLFSGRPHIIALSVSSSKGSTELKFHVGQLGDTPAAVKGSCLGKCPGGQKLRFPPESNFVLGSTRFLDLESGVVGLEGDVHFVAIYNRSLSDTEFQKVAVALPNSIPAIRADARSVAILNSGDKRILLGSGPSFFDFEGDSFTIFSIMELPTSGKLFSNEVSIKDVPFVVSNTDILTFLPEFGETSPFDCSSTRNEPCTTFSYHLSDGIGDGSTNCITDLAESCLSISRFYLLICIPEKNCHISLPEEISAFENTATIVVALISGIFALSGLLIWVVLLQARRGQRCAMWLARNICLVETEADKRCLIRWGYPLVREAVALSDEEEIMVGIEVHPHHE